MIYRRRILYIVSVDGSHRYRLQRKREEIYREKCDRSSAASAFIGFVDTDNPK